MRSDKIVKDSLAFKNRSVFFLQSPNNFLTLSDSTIQSLQNIVINLIFNSYKLNIRRLNSRFTNKFLPQYYTEPKKLSKDKREKIKIGVNFIKIPAYLSKLY